MDQQYETVQQTDVGGGYMPPAPPEKNPWILRGVVAGGMVILFGLGAVAGASSVEAPPAPPPVVKTETVTNTVEVEVTPTSCLLALDRVEDIIDSAADGLIAASHGFEAASNLDIAGLYEANAEMRAASQATSKASPGFQRARDACRASA